MIRWYIILRAGYVPFAHKPQWINCLLLHLLRRISAPVQTLYFLIMYTGCDRAAVMLFEVYSVGTRLESQLSQRVFPCFSPFVIPVRINTTSKYSTNTFSETLAITTKTNLLSHRKSWFSSIPALNEELIQGVPGGTCQTSGGCSLC